MTEALNFIGELEAKVAEQLKAQRVGYLLGAGSSYLDNAGYPLAFELWDLIKDRIVDPQKRATFRPNSTAGRRESNTPSTCSTTVGQWTRRIGIW